MQRVKQKIASSDINSIADERLGGSYDIDSMWKVVNTAMSCTQEVAAERPTMATVVVQLKESLALEEAREDRFVTTSDDRHGKAIPTGDSVASVSTFDLSGR